MNPAASIPPAFFSTARLSARPPTGADAPAVHRMLASDPETIRFTRYKPGLSLSDVVRELGQQAEAWNRRSLDGNAWLLFCGDELVGMRSCRYERFAGTVKFAGVFGTAHRGQGFGPESLRWLTDWFLAQPDFFRAQGTCDCENRASLRGMEKAGYAVEGVLRRYGVMVNVSPEPRDFYMCARVR